MATGQIKNFDSPDGTTTFQNGKTDLVHLGDGTVGKITLQPGWRWSENVKPIAKTDWCEVRHVGITLSGRLHVVMSTGEEMEVGPGDLSALPPGHDAWVVGNEPYVALDWAGMANYAKPA